MGTNVDNRFARGSLSGNTNVPRLSQPRVRGKIRRSDPDGSHAQAYWTGLASTSLVIEVGTIDGGIINTVTVNFSSNFYSAAVSAVNAAAPTDIVWVESDGFPCIQSAHAGAKNYLKITSGTAAAIFGMPIFPQPGGFSRAGDIAPAPPDKSQQNPQTTELLAHDEDLSAQGINRAIVGSLLGVDQALSALDREIAGWRTVEFTVDGSTNTLVPVNVGSDPSIASIRVHTGAIAQALTDGYGYVDIIDVQNGSRQTLYSTVLGVTSKVTAQGLIYGNSGPPGTGALTWGSPNNRRPDTTAAAQSLKQASTTITGIEGSTIIASGATFITNRVQPGDHILISSATNSSPFNHNGEFVVVSVPSETEVVVRPLGYVEEKVNASNDAPPALNQTLPSGVYGNISVYIGWSFPLGGKTASGSDNFRIYIGTGTGLSGGTNVWVRLPVSMTVREAISNGFLENVNSSHDPQVAFKNLANEFTQRNQFDAGITLPTMPANSGLPLLSRILAPFLDSDDPVFVLMVESDGVDINGNNYPMRMYLNRSSGGLTITTNSKHQRGSDTWSKDVNGVAAARIDIAPSGVKYFHQTASDNSLITSDAWPEIPLTLNAADLGTTTGGATPRIDVPGTNESGGGRKLTLLLQSKSPNSAEVTRLYVDAGAFGGFVITTNASWAWGTQLWTKDDTGAASLRITLGQGGFSILGRDSGAGTWNDSSWNTVTTLSYATGSGIALKGNLNISALSGAPNTALVDYDGTTNSPNYQLITEVSDIHGTRIRTYARPDGGVFITSGCKFVSPNWVSDSTGGTAFRFVGTTVTGFFNDSSTSWTDTVGAGGWDGESAQIDSRLTTLFYALNLGQSLTGASGARTAKLTGTTRGGAEGSSIAVTLLEEWTPVAGGAVMRLYIGDTNKEYRLVVNARWDGTDWNQDNGSAASFYYSYGSTSKIGYKPSGASPWTDAQWNNVYKLDPTVGSLVLTPIVGSLTPQLATTTSGGKNRWAIGSHGYQTGYTRDLTEFWDASTIKRWTAGAVTLGGPTPGNITTSGQPSTPWLTVAGTPLNLSATTIGWGWQSYLDLVLTFHVMGTDVANGSWEWAMYDGPNNSSIALSYNLNPGTGWQLFTERDSSHNTTTNYGTALTNNTWNKVQLEYHGSATEIGVANGGHATVRVYINGILAFDINNGTAFTYIPDNDGVVVNFDINMSRTSGTGNLNVGPMRLTYNYLADSING